MELTLCLWKNIFPEMCFFSVTLSGGVYVLYLKNNF